MLTCFPRALDHVILLAFDGCHPRPGRGCSLVLMCVSSLTDDAKHLLLAGQPFVCLLRRNG